jgi:hypothetical protein
VWLKNATDVGVYGYGGNACPQETYPAGFAQVTPSLFRVDDSRVITLVNLISYDMASTLALQATLAADDLGANERSAVACSAPDEWSSVVERLGGHNSSITLPLDRPVVWRRT